MTHRKLAKLPLLLFAGLLSAQTFEVASVRRLTDLSARKVETGQIQAAHGSVVMRGVSMQLAMRWAWRLQSYQLQGPEWIYWTPRNTQPRFDIQAKADPGASEADLRVMMQNLLVERFGLKYHTEEIPVDCYVLTVDAGGLKMEQSDSAEPGKIVFSKDRSFTEIRSETMEDLSEEVFQALRTPIVDQTGLPEAYSGAFHMTVESHDALVNSIVTGFQKELGLKLTKGKTRAKLLKIDQIEQFPNIQD